MTSKDVSIKNMNQVLWAVRRTDKGIKDELAKESNRIATKFVAQARGAAATKQAVLAAQSIRVRKGLVPKVAVGGSKRMSTSTGSVRAGDVFGGSEWGSSVWPQFGRSWNRKGVWFFGTMRAHGREYAEDWISAVDIAIRKNWHN